MEIIQWLQSFHSPFLDFFWGAITQLSSEEFFLIVAPVIFWCVDSRKGWLLFTLLMTSVTLDEAIKNVVAEPRPDPRQVRVIMAETAPDPYAFPSGHSDLAAVFWGYLAVQIRRWIAWLVAGIIILMVGISRLYLGLHWPIDVLGGFVLGFAFVALATWLTPRWPSLGIARHARLWPFLGVVLPILAAAVFPDPIAARTLGALAGFNIGYLVLLPRFGGDFPVHVSLPKQVVKALIGLAGLLLLRTLLKAAFPDLSLFHFLRYAIMGLWGGLIAPLLFQKLFAENKLPVSANVVG